MLREYSRNSMCILRGNMRRLNKQNASVIINRSTSIISTANGMVESHDSSDSTVDFLCGLFFACFYVASRVGTDINVVHHPSEYRMAAVGQFLLQCQFHKFLAHGHAGLNNA